jgi:hypothetical protein
VGLNIQYNFLTYYRRRKMKTILSLVLVVAMASMVCAQPPQGKGPKIGPKPQVKQEKPEKPMWGPPPWARKGQMRGPERPFQSQRYGKWQGQRGPAVHHRGHGPQWRYHRGPKQGFKGEVKGRKYKGHRKNGEITITITIK